MNSEVEAHGAIPNDPQPLDLAQLSSTNGPQPDNGVDYTNEKITVIPTTEKDQPHLQPGLDQQQRRQVMDPEKHSNAPAPVSTQTTTAAGGVGRKFKMAGLVDRVRLAQLEERSHQPHHDSPQGEKHHRLSFFPSRDKNTQDPEKYRESHDSSPPGIHYEGETRSPIIHNSIKEDDSSHHKSHHLHASEGEHPRTQPSVHHFPKMFSKDGVRNALFLNSAATAFTKSSRARTMDQVDVHLSSLAVTGSAVPALWLRRDNKGRRPVAVTDSEVDLGVGKQIIFRVELQYGDVKWVIKRTLYEFYKLHLHLTAKRFDRLPKFPSQVAYAFSMAKASMGMKSDEKVEYIRTTNLARRRALQTYLIQVLQVLDWTVAYDLYEFLEISSMSLTKDMGWKGKEAYVDTKITDKSKAICGFGGISKWVKSWAILRDSYMAFCSGVGSDEPTDVIIFDQNFFVQQKGHTLGLNLHHIEIGNTHRKIEIKGEHNREMLEWMEHFDKMKNSSPWLTSHRFGSFAPEREDAKVRYYVDGKDYFHAVSDAILAAKTEIYIADWWLSPELYLRRPPANNEEFRLDRLLKRKAMEGVMIYIVVYKEISLALTLDSAHTKIWLQDLHPNIQVQRHPDHISVNATQFWAHHEKICVIDCRLAFIGGLDLCFGRYDSRTHQLSDYHPSGKSAVWPGVDYSNPRIKDFVNVKDYNSDLIEKKLLARMPWHDVSVGMAGKPARDIARHFVQRWNFVKREKGMKKSHMKFLTPKGEFVSTRNESGWTGSQKVQILRSSTLWSQGVDLERSIQDAYLSSIENAEHFIYIENQFFVTLAVENGNPDIKNKIGLALVNRIVRAHNEGKKFRVIVVMPLMPAFEADIMSSEAGTLRKVMHFQYVSISRGGNSVLERLIAQGVDPDQYIGFFGLRSFDRIKHGKFDAIVEAVKEEERRRTPSPTKANAATAQSQSSDNVANSDGSEAKTPPPTNNKTNGKSRSLASKFLLEPLPQGEEAERIKAIYEQRKAADLAESWDDSITKKAMNPSQREQGYIPAATENSMADTELNAQIQRDTDQAEADARSNHYRGADGGTSPELVEGFGTKVRSAIERVKGYKEGGDVEPKHHKITRNRHLYSHDDPRRYPHGDEDDVEPKHHKITRNHHLYSDDDPRRYPHGDEDDDDSAQVERPKHGRSKHGHDSKQERNSRYGHEDFSSTDELAEEKQSIHDAESIVEPFPETGQEGAPKPGTGTTTEGGTTAPVGESSAPATTAPGTIVDDELDDFVTEQLYIHSKLMIVDDRIIICGSANINDRSQVGFRDSEIAIIIEDTHMVDSKMNGVAYKAGKLAHALRTDLFKEHLGLLPHVEHDVVTKASVLPVDLDAPHKDPEQARLELIRKAHEPEEIDRQKRQSEFQQKLFDAQAQGSGSGSVPILQVPAGQPHVSLGSSSQDAPESPGLLDPSQLSRHRGSYCSSISSQSGARRVFHEGTGHVHEYVPDAEEVKAFDQWHSPHVHRDAKKAASNDPEAANAIVMDPLHDDFYEGWWKRVAVTNTGIFREVFRCVPDNTVETWDEYKAFVPNPKKVIQGHVAMPGATAEVVTAKLQGVTGHLVEFPIRFLQKENLMGGVVEGTVVPMEIFT
ncbi:hypothetical protein CPC16_011439 [Podila verticillata]|nr:hypothetical protein CPC16_011439 [Podila verticillata]